jgi:hypothetical protein
LIEAPRPAGKNQFQEQADRHICREREDPAEEKEAPPPAKEKMPPKSEEASKEDPVGNRPGRTNAIEREEKKRVRRCSAARH